MPQQQGDPIVIVGPDGTEHEFPAGMDPKRAAAIVREQYPGPDGLLSKVGDAALQGVLGPGKALWNIPKAIYEGVKKDPVAALPDIGGAIGGMAGPAGAAVGGAAGKAAEYGSRLALNSNLDRVPTNSTDALLGVLKAAAIQGGMQAAPAVVGQIGKATKAVGRNLLGRAVAPNLSELGHMAESTKMLPTQIRGQIADTLHNLNIPVNPGGTLKLRGIVSDMNRGVRGLAKSAGERGESSDAGKLLKDTADYIFKNTGSAESGHVLPTMLQDTNPTPAIESARGKLRAMATDTKSELVKPYRQHSLDPDVSLAGATARKTGKVVPNPEVDPESLLDISQGLYRKHRGDYGLKGSDATDAAVDKAWNHAAGKELERVAPGVSDLRAQEHEALNALEPLFRRTYNQSNQRPVSLYQFLAATTADPVMGALSIGLTPQMMGSIGHGGMRLGSDLGKLEKSPQVWANLLRTALLSQMSGSQNPE